MCLKQFVNLACFHRSTMAFENLQILWVALLDAIKKVLIGKEILALKNDKCTIKCQSNGVQIKL